MATIKEIRSYGVEDNASSKSFFENCEFIKNKSKGFFRKFFRQNRVNCIEDTINVDFNKLISVWIRVDKGYEVISVRCGEKIDIVYSTLSNKFKTDIRNFYVSNGIRVLTPGKTLNDYGIMDQQTLFFHWRLFGGHLPRALLLESDESDTEDEDELVSSGYIFVTIRYAGRLLQVPLNTRMPLREFYDDIGNLVETNCFSLWFREAHLLRHQYANTYGITQNCYIRIVFGSLLGGNPNWELQVGAPFNMNRFHDHNIFALLSSMGRQYLPNFGVPDLRLSSGNITYIISERDMMLKFVEDTLIIFVDFYYLHKRYANKKGKSNVPIKEHLFVVVKFLKMQSITPMVRSHVYEDIIKYFKRLFTSNHQSDTVEDGFEHFRNLIDDFEAMKETKIYLKVYKFTMYLIANCLLDKVGITLDNLSYGKLEQEAIKRNYHMGPSFLLCACDTISFLLSRGYQCYKTGSIDPIYHSCSSYEEWFKLSHQLKQEAQFLNNPEAVLSKSRFEYFHDLNDSIEKGEAILKHCLSSKNYERKMIGSMVADLKLIKSVELTKSAAQKERKAPFSILLHGESGVAKSTFCKMLFYQYGHLFNLPVDDEYRYVRDAKDDYWVNFNSTQWALVMDDIACIHPNAAPNGDPSMMEMIQVVNNIPFVPIQADLADKGRTPLVSRFVIATTNVMNLNAHNYFSHPYAVLRRLPNIVDLKPKDEYKRDGTDMIDPSKLPILGENEYPDFWVITIYGVRKLNNGKTEHYIKYEFDKINEFLAWFNETAREFEGVQDKAHKCDVTMSKVTLCSMCDVPLGNCECLQAGEEFDENGNEVIQLPQEMDTPWVEQNVREIRRRWMNVRLQSEDIKRSLIGKFWDFMFILFVKYNIIHVLSYLFTAKFYMTILEKCCGNNPEIQYAIMSALGAHVESKIGKRSKIILAMLTSVSMIYTLCKFLSFTKNIFIKDEILESEDASNSNSLDVRMEPQSPDEEKTNQISRSANHIIGDQPKPMDIEKDNVWYADKFVCTSYDVSKKTLSWKGLDENFVEDKVRQNCFVAYFYRKEDELTYFFTKGFCLKGNIMIINYHALLPGIFRCKLVFNSNHNSISNNCEFTITLDDIGVLPERDIAFFKAPLPPRSSILDLFPPKPIGGEYKGKYISLTSEGDPDTKTVNNIVKVFDQKTNGTPNLTVWYGVCEPKTKKGDCGSLLLVRNGYGPIILGMHTMGFEDSSGAVALDQEFFQDILNDPYFMVPEPNEPLLSSKSKNIELQALHHKSTVRYVPEGYATVYGSLNAPRARMKSNVENSLLRNSMEKRGYVCNYTKPDLISWKPYNLALTDMVITNNGIPMNVLNAAKKGFITDILQKLDPKWKNELMVYDKFTAINGASGVTYVDKINRNTSMGNPWKECKKKYLVPLPPMGDLQEPVDFVDEINERIDHILDLYNKHERFSPVFCAHLKDEAISNQKALLGKVRVFTGAPADWSVVVRMYLLSFIRVMQYNKFTFEAAPGVVAQSSEWGDMYRYLTRFGEDRMVAGDYSKFDKRMSPSMILAAFDVIKSVCVWGGYSQNEIKIIDCIAHDTAYPVVDFNGDLIQFHGSNPSGHPLTVVINSIVNSLYLRSAYILLNPNYECDSFKNNVNVMTYGDDNALGVSRNCTWYNHTSISQILGVFGIKYTMADKESESIPYIHITNVSFLKRRWRYDKDVNDYLAPLEEESIIKSLMINVKSKTITHEAQAIEVIGSAMREYFFYGKEKFSEMEKLLKEIVEENGLNLYVKNSTFPTWDQLLEDFREASRRISIIQQ